MRRLYRYLLALCLTIGAAISSPAPDFKMADGSVISGELVAPNDDGSVIRRSSGGLTSRIGWDRFDQATLHELAKDAKLKELVEAFIDSQEDPAAAARPEVVVKDPPGKVARPAKRPGLFSALFSTPAGLFIVLVILLANLYAGYEVAIYRNQPIAAVVGASIILPILGPVLFLCLPTRVRDDVQLEAQFEAPQEVQNTGAQDLAAAGLAGSKLSLSSAHKAGAGMQTAHGTYKANEVEFNRAFFERTFPLYFRISRTEADKDTILALRSGKGEVIATRISRISSNEIGVVTQKGHEVQLKFADITEVQVRAKSA